MSDFFESEIIQEELSEINRLQEKIYGSLMSFSMMSREEKLEHVDILTTLLEKQQVMYTRLSLSDDPQAIEMKENLRKSVALMGFPPETDMQTLFDSMNATISSLKNYIDAIVHYCEINELEVESVTKLVSKPLKEKLKWDATRLNFMKRTSRAKLPI